MKKVLLLGTGMVAKPITDYMLNHHIKLTIASQTKEKLINGKENVKSVIWTTDDLEMLNKMVSENDIVVSMLPDTFQVAIAKVCIKHKKNLVTTSYVSPEMKELDQGAKDAGIIILNEIGMDHMSAMHIIDKVHAGGGKIKEFYSFFGALAAPEETDNPFRYKFSVSPYGVIKAGKNGAKFLKDGEVVEIPTENLFKNPLQIDFAGIGPMEVYPYRDSQAYNNIYNLTEIETIYRGTVCYPNWCETMDAIQSLGMISYENRNFEGKSYCDIMAENMGVYPANVKEKVAEKLNLTLNNPAITAIEWLGLFSKERIQIKEGSTFELTTNLMRKKMTLPENAHDMVIMQQWFLVENINDKKEVIKSQIIDFGTEKDTSFARIVVLPAAITIKMILEEKIRETGIQIPAIKSIYEPVLNEMENYGISTEEKWNLPENRMLS